MRTNLRAPCRHCPFRVSADAIRFRCAERAAEIEEQAYRNGFPCHQSAVKFEFEDEEGESESESSGFIPGPNTQHCAGSLILFIKAGYSSWPGIGNNERLAERLAQQLEPAFDEVFDDEEAFITASRSELDDE